MKMTWTVGCLVIGAFAAVVACAGGDSAGQSEDGRGEGVASGPPKVVSTPMPRPEHGTSPSGCADVKDLKPELEPQTLLSACASLATSETCANGDRDPGEVCFRSLKLVQPALQSVGQVLAAEHEEVIRGWRIAVGDLDGDDQLDLVASVHGEAAGSTLPSASVHGNAHALVVFWGAGGTFESGLEIGVGTGAVGDPRVVDLDSDGRLDVVVWGADGLEVYYGEGDRRFERLVFALPPDEPQKDVSVGDFNADGVEDILLDGGFLLAGAGQRSLGPYERMAPGGMAMGMIGAVDDLDGDGSRDLVALLAPEGTSHAQWRVALGAGEGGTNVASIIPGADQSWIFLGDFDGGQAQELAGLIHTAGEDRVVQLELRLWSLNGSEYELHSDVVSLTPLRKVGGARPIAPTAADVDGDGDADLVFSLEHEYNETNCDVPPAWRAVHIVLGDGQGGFSEPECHPALQHLPLDLSVADFNGDGLADIAAVSMLGGIEVLLSNP